MSEQSGDGSLGLKSLVSMEQFISCRLLSSALQMKGGPSISFAQADESRVRPENMEPMKSEPYSSYKDCIDHTRYFRA